MEPIINPSLFYWAEVFDAIHKIGLFALCVGIVGAFIIGISFAVAVEYKDKSATYADVSPPCDNMLYIEKVSFLLFLLYKYKN